MADTPELESILRLAQSILRLAHPIIVPIRAPIAPERRWRVGRTNTLFYIDGQYVNPPLMTHALNLHHARERFRYSADLDAWWRVAVDRLLELITYDFDWAAAKAMYCKQRHCSPALCENVYHHSVFCACPRCPFGVENLSRIR